MGLAVFQIALIMGAPLGKFAWGGAHDVLPRQLRIASISSIILYAIFAAFVLSKASVLELIPNNSAVNIGMWVFTVYFFLGIVMNAASRSKSERLVMTPVAAVLAVLFLLVTLA